MDYDKLIEQYRQAADKWEKRHPITDTFDLRVQDALRDAATAIETLQANLARVTAEKDAAVEELENYMVQDVVAGNEPCGICAKASNIPCECCDPKWRGIKKEDKP